MMAAPMVNPICATDTAKDRRRRAQRVTAAVVEGTNPSMPMVTSAIAPRNMA